jgi:periplasmic copper chaperone A
LKQQLVWMVCLATLGLSACSERHDHAEAPSQKNEQPVENVQGATPAQVQQGITVLNAWVRPTVGEQDATGAYLTINSEEAMSLVGVASPAAEIAEVHEMKMEGDVMRMRMAPRIEIRPGESLELKPGGYHVMLMALTGPVNVGQEVELSLQFEKPDGSRLEMPVKVVAAQNSGGQTSGGNHHSHGGDSHRH